MASTFTQVFRLASLIFATLLLFAIKMRCAIAVLRSLSFVRSVWIRSAIFVDRSWRWMRSAMELPLSASLVFSVLMRSAMELVFSAISVFNFRDLLRSAAGRSLRFETWSVVFSSAIVIESLVSARLVRPGRIRFANEVLFSASSFLKRNGRGDRRLFIDGLLTGRS